LWDLLFSLSGQGVTFFVTTHYMDEAERCGRVGYIYLSKLIAIGTVEELQSMPEANPPGTARNEVTSSNSSAALAVVRSLPYVREATIFGRSIHVLMDDSPEARRRLKDDLESAGYGPVHVETVASSLEDVFVTLTTQTMALQAKAGKI
jgi:ABC-2 type transport system ATP-binding protein